MSVMQASMERFAQECAPKSELGAPLQYRLAAWQARNFGAQPTMNQVLGVCEEAGELADAVLQDEEMVLALIRSGAPQLVYVIAIAAAAGRAAHATLKETQKIRGMEDRQKACAARADALADINVFSQQVATVDRLDYDTLVEKTVDEVLARDWTKK